jgi:radical SAM protein with 4Fe4S-binding SPASM domain
MRSLIFPRVPLPLLRAVNRAWCNVDLFLRMRQCAATGRVKPPAVAYIEPVNICPLRCPLCPTGTDKLAYPQGMMTLECFRAVIDKMPFLKVASLYNWGESLLNPEICSMISYARQKGIVVNLDTSLSIRRPDKFWEELMKSGLNFLRIALDGCSRETYERYRIGGHYEWVMENLATIVAIKKKIRHEPPVIIWKFLVHRYNEGELPDAARKARAQGLEFQPDYFQLSDDLPDCAFDDSLEARKRLWLPLQRRFISPRYTSKRRRKRCFNLFTSVTITPQGKVFPCCYVTSAENTWGDLRAQSFDEIWNGPEFAISRKLFLDGVAPECVPTICGRCYPSL